MTTTYKSRPGQIAWDEYRSTPGGAIMMTPELEAKLQGTDAAINAETAAKVRNQRRWENIFKAAGIAIPTAGIGLSMAGAGAAGGAMASAPSAAGSASSSIGATAPKVAATSGVMSRLGNIFSSAGFETAANTGLSLLGMRRSNKANDQARQDTLAYQTKQIELEQQRLAQELQNATLDREDARALNAAIQELEKKKFALQQESAQFDRENALFNRGIIEKEQGVKDRYRSSIQEPAAARMRSILGL